MATGASSSNSTSVVDFRGLPEVEAAKLVASGLESADLASLKVSELERLLGQPPSNALLRHLPHQLHIEILLVLLGQIAKLEIRPMLVPSGVSIGQIRP